MQRLATFSIVTAFLFASTGCAILQQGKESMATSAKMMKARPHDNMSETAEEHVDDWGFVGEEGRAEMPREQDPDGWLRKLTMSQRARDIEKSLGID